MGKLEERTNQFLFKGRPVASGEIAEPTGRELREGVKRIIDVFMRNQSHKVALLQEGNVTKIERTFRSIKGGNATPRK